ncbi:MAG: polysaccharide biosynthesis C-terminal domain-containing protein [Isosphaeraceae bacterium]
MSTASPATTMSMSASSPKALPPVLGRLLSGTFWLALRVPLQFVFSLWTTRLVLDAIGPDGSGAYRYAWGFSFFQFLFEFGASSALQRQISDAWTRGDRDGVDRAIASGMNFYAVMAIIQVAALLGVAYWGTPHSGLEPSSYPLVIKLLWLQAITAPCFGVSVVVSSVLQAARRYDFVPRYELAITVLRPMVLVLGVHAGVDFFWIVATQTAIQVGLGLGPALWVMVRELDHVPHFRGARWVDYKALGHISFYMALIQISVVIADKIDTTILGFMIPKANPQIAVYDVVSKGFLQLRQTGWMLAYLVMPAVASLAAANDDRGLERVKYDGTRIHIGLLLPVGLLAWIYAAPFLSLWCGDRLGYDAANVAPLMRLFLVAAIPLVLSVPVQMSIGLNKIKVIALAALVGSLVNLPVSCYLTARIGVAGVIWGTVLTTLFSNLLVPGLYVFRELKIDLLTYLKRTVSAPMAGALLLVAVSGLLRSLMPVAGSGYAATTVRTIQLILHLTAGTLAYIIGYLLVPAGRGDLTELAAKLRRR